MRKAMMALSSLALLFVAFNAFATEKAGMGHQATAQQVTIDNFKFTPAVLTVRVGTEVTWVNHDEEPHTVVSADGPKVLKSRALDTNQKFSYTFKSPGTYTYYCTIHPYMVGKVVVQ